MSMPSLPVRDELAPLAPAATNGTTLRRWPMATVGAWYGLLGKQQPSAAGLVAKPRPSVSTVARLRRMRQCGRALPIWILIWLAVLAVPPRLLEHRWQRTGPAHEARKWPALRQFVSTHADRPLILMLGGSRVCWAFRADHLDEMPDSDGRPLTAFNYGIPTAGPISNLFSLRDMLADGIRPRFLLIEFLPPLLREPQRGARAYNEEGWIGFENLSTHRFLQWLPYLKRPEKRTHEWLEGRIFPWYAFRRSLAHEVECLTVGKPFPKYQAIDERGWRLPSDLTCALVTRPNRLEIERLGFASGLSHFRVGKKPLKALREILELCRREKIPTALVWMPESSDFRGWYSAEATTTIHGLLDELRQTYGVSVINARTWVRDDDFEDGQHTLLHGAEVFTSRLRAELAPLLAESAAGKSD